MIHKHHWTKAPESEFNKELATMFFNSLNENDGYCNHDIKVFDKKDDFIEWLARKTIII